MRWKNAGIMVMVGLMLTGCNQSSNENPNDMVETMAINDDDYAALLPFQVSDARQKHAALNTNLRDTLAIDQGLMELSKEHFSPKEYAYRENQFLNFNALDAVNDGSGLLGRESSDNPNGLNPTKDSEFDTDRGKLKDPVLVLDIFELDWYSSKELEGLSLAIVLQSSITTADKVTYEIEKDTFKMYSEECARKVVKYLRKTHPEIGNDLPIYVTIFDAYNTDGQEGLPGKYKEDAYFSTGTNASFSELNNDWCMFPTTKSNTLDSTNHSYFVNYKNKLSELDLGDDIAIIGKGKYMSKKLQKLNITVTAHAKTGAEMHAIVQLLNENLSIFASTDFEITVEVNCDDIHIAVINRPKGTTKTNTILI